MYHILIVDDEANVVENIADNIDASGLDAVCYAAYHPKQALQYMQYISVDIIISDYQMPYMTGVELAQKAQEQNPNVKLIMISAYHDGVLRILPAVPASWKTGEIRGMRAYGGHMVSAKWDEQSVSGSVTAGKDEEILLRCFGEEQKISAKAGETVSFAFKRQ